MSRLVELPDPVFQALQREAEARGQSPAAWIAAHLDPPGPALAPQGTLADLLAGRVGGAASREGESLSVGCGEKFAEYVAQKRQKGEL